jgi:ABC-type multidrug transport system permease subunit
VSAITGEAPPRPALNVLQQRLPSADRPGRPTPGDAPSARGKTRAALHDLRWLLTDVRVLTWRTLARIAATPEQLLNVTVQPLIFALLFSYVFNGAIIMPGHVDYRQYLIAGVFAINMGGTAQGAAIGLAVDLSTGLVDRFRSLPMSRAAVLAGRTVADLVLTMLAATVTVAAGLLVGWRIHSAPRDVLLALGLALLFAYAAAWAGACVGMLARGAESAQAVGLTVIVPLSLTSNAFISTAGLTPWLRDVANWNPISVLADACRHLLGNPDPAMAIHAWPMQHPELASALWSVILIATLAPFAVWLYVRRTRH